MNELMIFFGSGATPSASQLCTGEFKKVFEFIGLLITILRWGIPIVLIILGTVDVGKAVVSGDDKKQKAAYQTFLKRLIAAVVVFLVPAIVGLVMGTFATGDGSELAACKTALGL